MKPCVPDLCLCIWRPKILGIGGKICRGKSGDHAGAMTATTRNQPVTLWARNASCHQLYICMLLPLDGTGIPCHQHATYCVITHQVACRPAHTLVQDRIGTQIVLPSKAIQACYWQNLAKFGKIWQTLWHAISLVMTLGAHPASTVDVAMYVPVLLVYSLGSRDLGRVQASVAGARACWRVRALVRAGARASVPPTECTISTLGLNAEASSALWRIPTCVAQAYRRLMLADVAPAYMPTCLHAYMPMTGFVRVPGLCCAE